ncbi:MAG: GNAT family N-acetyltransferase [Anaerolineae bacterium]|nr:GNAT family N-acetyltransferase [Anaerolineae bacterium]
MTPDEGPYRIVQATWRDVRAVRCLERAAFSVDAYPWFELLAMLTFPGVVNFKAVTQDGRLVGHIAGDPRPSEGFSWIVTVAVDAAHRRRGIGRRLLRTCEAALATPRIRLTVRAGNTGAIALYEQEGYRRCSVWRRYYRDGEDGIIMEKYLMEDGFGRETRGIGR